MKLTITICDDETVQRENLRSMVLEHYPEANIIECRKAEEAVGCAAESHILFLDIDTGTDMDGMAAARTIYSRKEEEGRLYSLPLIIFITGFPERMQEAFGVHAFYFLEKPVKRQIFLPLLKEAVSVAEKLSADSNEKTSPENSLMIRNGDQALLIPFRMIIYVESFGRDQHLHVSKSFRGSEEEIVYQGSMEEMERLLPKNFYRIHRGFIVNMNYVVGYGKNGVEMSEGSHLLISRYKYKEFVERYLHFIGFEA